MREEDRRRVLGERRECLLEGERPLSSFVIGIAAVITRLPAVRCSKWRSSVDASKARCAFVALNAPWPYVRRARPQFLLRIVNKYMGAVRSCDHYRSDWSAYPLLAARPQRTMSSAAPTDRLRESQRMSSAELHLTLLVHLLSSLAAERAH
jgi:hypothetical protein